MSNRKRFVSRDDGLTASEAFAHNLQSSIDEYNREVGSHDPKTCRGCGRPAPYGFVIQNGGIVPDDAEQDVLHVVRKMKDAGLSIGDIAQELNAAGIAAR